MFLVSRPSIGIPCHLVYDLAFSHVSYVLSLILPFCPRMDFNRVRLVAENEMEGPISFRQPPLPMYGYHLASPLAIIRATLLFRRRRGRRTSRRKQYFHTVTETQKQKQTLTQAQAQKGRADPEKGRHGPITPQIPNPNASGLVPPLRLIPHPVFWSVLPHLPGETFHRAHNEGGSWR